MYHRLGVISSYSDILLEKKHDYLTTNLYDKRDDTEGHALRMNNF